MTARARRARRRSLLTLVVGVVLVIAAPTAAEAKPVIEGTKEIKLTTKSSDAGRHPVLRWRSVAAASGYVVVVQTPQGEPFWTWQGTETRVRLGGGPLDAAERTEGASLVSTKVWFVIALDAEHHAIASSAKRKITP